MPEDTKHFLIGLIFTVVGIAFLQPVIGWAGIAGLTFFVMGHNIFMVMSDRNNRIGG